VDEKVIEYLIKHYDIDEEAARQAVTKDFKTIVDEGINADSKVYFIGDKIADELDLDEYDDDDEYDDEYDDNEYHDDDEYDKYDEE
jgi:hypothetical protein